MFERKPLRADVGAEILGRIIDGRLKSGTRINESHLAVELGISRTPLREAMLCLTTEGALASDMGRGFRVPRLEGREVADVLQALSELLPAAIRHGRQLELRDHVEAGNLLGRARLNQGDPSVFCEQVYLLLRLLAHDCPNDVLRRECTRLVRLSLRYLFEAQSRGWEPAALLGNLERGLDELRRGDRTAAAVSLGRTFRELGDELPSRFPAAVADHA
ncbi:MAG TPA: GntR family transcriptional regulator [Candidatus Krumholzibacteria bacterium]|nr:GntR family transcriptional regulator [Candidatus Krumholzibacteria bacterium]HPD73181.1 GntR family transcriptional regulator [Candidatus Krumholzibacteria bacterium]HRY41941.1 GntR family transcriptional regulator [Candidatus Krumholzibacteria bacterium]